MCLSVLTQPPYKDKKITFFNPQKLKPSQLSSHFYFAFTFMHLADAFIQSNLQCIQIIHFLLVCVCSLGIEATTFVLLTQCSTTEPALYSTFITTTEVRPLSKAPNPQLFLGCHSKMAAHGSGCVFAVCVCFCSLLYVCTWMGSMQSTNSEYWSPVLGKVTFKSNALQYCVTL